MIAREIDLPGRCRPLRVGGQANYLLSTAKTTNGDEITSKTPIPIDLIEALLAQVSFCSLQNRRSTEPSTTDTSTLSP